ncbi:Retrovirus-related Pol polyprotein from transposon 17.6, partial [Mucuna pruriens]
MDAYFGYNQMRMHPVDEVKTAFITDEGSFYYRIGLDLEVYVDDMMAKSAQGEQHCVILTRIFDVLRKHKLKLNLEKCSFGIQAGNFLGYMLIRRGIEANPDKCEVVINIRSSRSVKEGVEIRYQRLEKAALALVVMARKLRPFFQSNQIVIRTNLPVKQVLRKLDLATWMVGRIVMGHVKAQVLVDFITELTPIGEAKRPSKG